MAWCEAVSRYGYIATDRDPASCSHASLKLVWRHTSLCVCQRRARRSKRIFIDPSLSSHTPSTNNRLYHFPGRCAPMANPRPEESGRIVLVPSESQRDVIQNCHRQRLRHRFTNMCCVSVFLPTCIHPRFHFQE